MNSQRRVMVFLPSGSVCPCSTSPEPSTRAPGARSHPGEPTRAAALAALVPVRVDDQRGMGLLGDVLDLLEGSPIAYRSRPLPAPAGR